MCNHYLGYLHEYEGIKELYQGETELTKKEWIKFFDSRYNYGHLFDYCPKCGCKIDKKSYLQYVKTL